MQPPQPRPRRRFAHLTPHYTMYAIGDGVAAGILWEVRHNNQPGGGGCPTTPSTLVYGMCPSLKRVPSQGNASAELQG